MTDRHDEFVELCAALALGAIDEADRARLDSHLAAGCPTCEKALGDFRDTSLVLAMAAPPVKPDAGLKTRVLAAFTDRPRPARSDSRAATPVPRASRSPLFPLFGALGWAAAALLLFAWIGEKRESSKFEADLAALTSRSRELEAALAEERGWLDSMSASEAKLASFAVTSDAPAPLEGWAVFDPRTQRAILVFENLRIPTDRDLELWAIRDGAPRSLGLIEVDAGGRALLRLREIPDPTKVGAFAVSLEAKGGSPDKTAPSGPVVMVGAL